MLPGENLINNPLSNGSNLLSDLIPSAPNFTTVKLWNSSIGSYGPSSTYLDGVGWLNNLTLPVGTGMLLTTDSVFTNTWVGNVLTGDGIPYGGGTLLPPSPFSGPDGVYLLGTITPTAVTGEDVFTWTLGRSPNEGEQVTTLDPASQIYTTTTYLGGGAWDNGTPELNVGESAFFIIPEPGVLGMFCLCSIAYVAARRLFMVG